MNRILLTTLTSLLMSGCVSVHKSGGVQFDGSKVVASGSLPIGFYYPGHGELQIVDSTSDSIVYSMDLPQRSGEEPVMIVIDPEKSAVIVKLSDGEKTKEQVLMAVNPKHRFEILYKDSSTGKSATTSPTDVR